jgi:hypothetical protein
MYKLLSLIKNLQQDPKANKLFFQFGKLGQPVAHSKENDWIFIKESEIEKSKCLVISLKENEVHVDFYKSNIDLVQIVDWYFESMDESLDGIRPFSSASFLKHTFQSDIQLQLSRSSHRSIRLDTRVSAQAQ